MPTILITGCSSGFGAATAELFLARGWNVIATMRTPRLDVLPQSDRLRVMALDVTEPASVTRAFKDAGPIDALVNNAGFGVPAPIELTTPEIAQALFMTNTLGALATMQAALPAFRAQRHGVIVNVSSSVTLKTLPVVGVYRASKAALNALTESLALEVEPFGIRVHLVLPGRSPTTRFGDNARPHLRGLDDVDYRGLLETFVAGFRDDPGPLTRAEDVSAAVWHAVTDANSPFCIAAGADAELWMAEHKTTKAS